MYPSQSQHSPGHSPSSSPSPSPASPQMQNPNQLQTQSLARGAILRRSSLSHQQPLEPFPSASSSSGPISAPHSRSASLTLPIPLSSSTPNSNPLPALVMSRRGSTNSFVSDLSPTDPSFHRFFSRKLSVTPSEVRVLVVDGDFRHARLVVAQLANAGYPVDVVDSTSAALTRLRRPPPMGLLGGWHPQNGACVDEEEESGQVSPSAGSSSVARHVPPPPPVCPEYSLVICDISTVQGIELLRSIRSDLDLLLVPVIMMASVDEMELAYSCLRAGADDYLVKPVKHEAVKGVWRSVWRKRKEKKVLQLLEEERNKRKTLEVKVESLEHQVSAAVETPLNLITQAVSTLLSSEEGMSDAAKASLRQVLEGLRTSNLYRPAFERVLSRTDVDAETKSWLASEVLRDVTSTLTSPTPGGAGGSPATAAGGSSPSGPRLRRLSEMHRRKIDRERTSSTSSILSVLPPAMEDPQDADPIASVTLPAQLPEPTHLPLLNSWNFDVWSYTHAELLVFLVDMFADLGLLDHFMINPAQFLDFLKDIERGYKPNPYHNFRHAFDVTQAAYLFLRTCCVCASDESYTPPSEAHDEFGAAVPPTPTSISYAVAAAAAAASSGAAPAVDPLDPFPSPPLPQKRKIPRLMFPLSEQLSFMLACVCHDLEHDGKTNNYHIQTQSPLALLYNDQSPLENRHMHEAYRLITHHKLLAHHPRTLQAEIRTLMVRCILSTDLAKHVDILAKFNEISTNFNHLDKEHRARSLEMLIKCADVSNVIRPLHLAKGWADCIQEEMFCQGDVERELGLPVSGFGDRLNAQSARLGLTFSEFMCAPLFRTMGRAISGMEMYLKNIAVTRDYWAGMQAEQEAAAAAAADEADESVSSEEALSDPLLPPRPLSAIPSETEPTDSGASVVHLGPTSRRSSARSVGTSVSGGGTLAVSPTVHQHPPLLGEAQVQFGATTGAADEQVLSQPPPVAVPGTTSGAGMVALQPAPPGRRDR
ncbi:hypothetical protein BCR44DRAFT_1433315 [Catenaria anguillulae PL171]|uniref:Phosphodiesterase n=1 Tax=Catenaria anguillulae PL171 TaxID=765915 RepID=A0A1Y2HN41_9FUNG|nr:hypothetical protein BCR44DRAFT_1433315 [Catenaria anguillulae PL171]